MSFKDLSTITQNSPDRCNLRPSAFRRTIDASLKLAPVGRALRARQSHSIAIKRRSSIFQWTALSARWPSPRRARDYGDWRSFATEDVLHGRRERRVVQDDGQRSN